MNDIKIEKPLERDADKINSLIIDVFMKCVAPDYSKEGIDFFLSICNSDEIREKTKNGTPIYIAKSDENIIGIIWTRDINHIARYFVDVAFQRKGIGKKLLDRLLYEIREKHKEIRTISVNSSPFALKAYEKYGFTKVDEEKVGNGMRYIPMLYKL